MAEPKDGYSLGSQRVRESFNPSQDGMVDKIKRQTADLIDLCEEEFREQSGDGERMRCAALAMTYYETACMYAVKAATAGK